MGLFSGIGGLLGGFAMEQASASANAARSWYYKKKEMEKSDEMQRAYAHDAPGITRRGYEDANMNPMLAYSNSAASEAISASGVEQGSTSTGSSAMQALQLKQQEEMNESTMKMQDQNGTAAREQAAAALQNANTNSAESKVRMQKMLMESNLSDAQKRKLIAETRILGHQEHSARFAGHVDSLKDRLLTKGENVVRKKTNWL